MSRQNILVPVPPPGYSVDLSGQGFGNRQTILDLHDNGFETGAVSWSGSADVLTGGATGQSQTYTLAETQWLNAQDILVIFNGAEGGASGSDQNKITLQNLVLNIYNTATGALVWSSGAFTPLTIQSDEHGTGSSGFLFQLDAAQATDLNNTIGTASFGTNLYTVGAAATAGCEGVGCEWPSGGGQDDISIIAIHEVVPEPGFYGALALGMGGLFMFARRKRNTAK